MNITRLYSHILIWSLAGLSFGCGGGGDGTTAAGTGAASSTGGATGSGGSDSSGGTNGAGGTGGYEACDEAELVSGPQPESTVTTVGIDDGYVFGPYAITGVTSRPKPYGSKVCMYNVEASYGGNGDIFITFGSKPGPGLQTWNVIPSSTIVDDGSAYIRLNNGDSVRDTGTLTTEGTDDGFLIKATDVELTTDGYSGSQLLLSFEVTGQ